MSVKSEKLEMLHRAMKKDKIKTYNFKVNYIDKYGKKILFDVVFSTAVQPYELLVAAIGTTFGFTTVVKPGYRIETRLDNNDYKDLIKILGVNYYGKTPFIPEEFFKIFSDSIPEYVRKERQNNGMKSLNKLNRNVTDENGMIFKGWRKHDGITSNVRNLEKTKEHFGFYAYMICKRDNISSKWEKYNAYHRN